MMNTKFKCLIMMYLSMTLALGSGYCNAILPTTDLANIAQHILKEIQKQAQQMARKKLNSLGMSHQTKVTGEAIDSANDSTSATITRLNGARQDIQNIETMAKYQPATSSCQSYDSSTDMNLAHERIEAQRDGRQKELSLRLTSAVSFSEPSNSKGSDGIQQLNADAVARIEQVQNQKSDSTPVDGGLLLSKKSASHSSKQENDSRMLVDIITAPSPSVRGDVKLKEEVLFELRKNLIKGIPNTILSEIAYKRSGRDGNSATKTIRDFAEKLFIPSSSEGAFFKEIASGKLAQPFSILRDVASIQAFKSHLAISMYESSLKRELVITTTLAANNQLD